LKRRLHQHLILRGSRDFAAVEQYDRFVEGVLQAANAKRQKGLAQELACMRALPASRLAEYREYAPVVSSQSLIRVRKHTYSVPSRLIGHALRVELYEPELKVYLGPVPKARISGFRPMCLMKPKRWISNSDHPCFAAAVRLQKCPFRYRPRPSAGFEEIDSAAL
jgi:hypothetical protein